jgi:hypothetical protein
VKIVVLDTGMVSNAVGTKLDKIGDRRFKLGLSNQ